MRHSLGALLVVMAMGCGSNSAPVARTSCNHDPSDAFVSRQAVCEGTAASICSRISTCGMSQGLSTSQCSVAFLEGCCREGEQDHCSDGSMTRILHSQLSQCVSALDDMTCDQTGALLKAGTFPSACQD